MAQTIEELHMGSALISSWIAIALSGAILPQAYAYFCGKPHNDHKIIGPLVGGCFLVLVLSARGYSNGTYLYRSDYSTTVSHLLYLWSSGVTHPWIYRKVYWIWHMLLASWRHYTIT